jgi:hypothetical protein
VGALRPGDNAVRWLRERVALTLADLAIWIAKRQGFEPSESLRARRRAIDEERKRK